MGGVAGSLGVRKVASVAFLVAVVGGLAASSVHHRGATSSRLEFNPATVWFPDEETGQVSLLDGLTASRIGVRSITGDHAHDDLLVAQSGVQSGSGAYVSDEANGTVAPIDGATLYPGKAVTFSPADDNDLTVASDVQATWVIHQNGSLAQEVDPFSLVPLGPPQRMASAGGPPVELADGSLWVAGTGGYVYSFKAALAHTRSHPVAGQFTLVEATDRPVIADVSTGEAVLLDSKTGQATRAVPFAPPGAASMVSGSGAGPYLVSVNPTLAEVQVTDLVHRRSSGTVVIGNPGSGYGSAVVAGDLVFVPSRAVGAVVVAQIVDDQLLLLGEVPVNDRNFDLMASNGSVWFDDPTNNTAGVISADLTAWLIPKTGRNGEGKLIGHLGPIHLSNGTTITARPPLNTGHSLNEVHPTHPSGGSSSGTVSIPGGGGGPPNSVGGPASGVPVPGFTWTPANPVAGQAVTFTDTTAGAHQIFQWTFGGIIPPQTSSRSPTVTWSEANIYTVSLVVTQAGQSYAVQRQVHVSAAPPPTRVTSSPPTSATTPPPTHVTTPPPTHGTTPPPPCTAGILSVIAGNGTAGPPSQGAATSSSLHYPTNLVVDGAGNIYVADEANNVIEKISPSGSLSIVAGTGSAGRASPGQLAVNSDLDAPYAVALDAAGNIYIADEKNFMIEKVNTAGILSVVAGTGTSGSPVPGIATNSPIGPVTGLAVDAAGNVYIPDQGAERIEKVNPTGVLSFVAGTGAAGRPSPGPALNSDLDSPAGVAVDDAGNIYIGDYGNNMIEKVDTAGILSIVAGTGTAGAPSPGAAANSDLNHPTGSTVDAAGNVYIADYDNNRIETVSPTGGLSIVAGTGTAGPPTDGPAINSDLNHPGGLALDAAGNLYITDDINNLVEKVSACP